MPARDEDLAEVGVPFHGERSQAPGSLGQRVEIGAASGHSSVPAAMRTIRRSGHSRRVAPIQSLAKRGALCAETGTTGSGANASARGAGAGTVSAETGSRRGRADMAGPFGSLLPAGGCRAGRFVIRTTLRTIRDEQFGRNNPGRGTRPTVGLVHGQSELFAAGGHPVREILAARVCLVKLGPPYPGPPAPRTRVFPPPSCRSTVRRYVSPQVRCGKVRGAAQSLSRARMSSAFSAGAEPSPSSITR